MKKYLLTVIACAAIGINVFGQNMATSKLSPRTKEYLLKAKTYGHQPVPGYVYKKAGGKLYLSALIKVNNPGQAGLDALGVKIGTKAGKIWTAQVPVENIISFTTLPGIAYIQLDEPVTPALDLARKYTHVDSVTSGINLPMPITGKNVVLGIIDAGFDFTHPTMYDTLYQNYRIKRVWLQKAPTGTPPSGFAYGNELTDSAGITTQGYDTAIISHGTHVAGIAGGSGYGGVNTNNNNQNNKRFRGMAFESDMVMVGIMPAPNEWTGTGEADIIDGMNYIYTYAASVGKPAVVNLSWGSTLGPHDGSSLFSQACDALTGPGKIFVCAAGNNGSDTVHLQKVFTPADTVVSTFVTFSPYLNSKSTWVDMWADTAKTFCVNLKLYNGNTEGDSTGFVCIDDAVHSLYLIGSNNDTCFVNVTTSSSEFNDKPRVFLDIYSKVPDNICLRVKSSDANVHMWEGYVAPPEGYYGYLVSLGYPWAVSGNTDYTVSDIGTTKSAITVAAYTSKTSFKNITGANLGYGGELVNHIASFSSHGPTQDGRIKPDIAAPGMALASSVNSFDTSYLPAGTNYQGAVCSFTSPLNSRTYYYAMLAGTSMASPCASGIVSLMMEVAPQMHPGQVKDILAATAIKDVYTGALPPQGTTIWGHGKINAYQAVLETVQTDNVQIVKNQLNCILFPNPNHGAFTLCYGGSADGRLLIQAYDMAGRSVYTDSWLVSGQYSTKQLNLGNLPKGNYIITVSGALGSSVIKTTIE